MTTKRILPTMPRVDWLTAQGREAQRTFRLVQKHSLAARGHWFHIGEIAAGVSDSAPRGSGIITRWREQYLGDVEASVVSNAIWCFRHRPSIEHLVRPTITDPTGMRKAWRVIVQERVEAFRHQRRNDVEALCDELKLARIEVDELLSAAAPRPVPGQPDDDLSALAGLGGPAAASATDPWAAIRSAIDQIDGGDAALARATLADVLRRAAEARP